MKSRRTRNFIGAILTEGGIVDSVSEVKEEVNNHFGKKFSGGNGKAGFRWYLFWFFEGGG